jgi:hypothetical protein
MGTFTHQIFLMDFPFEEDMDVNFSSVIDNMDVVSASLSLAPLKFDTHKFTLVVDNPYDNFHFNFVVSISAM